MCPAETIETPAQQAAVAEKQQEEAALADQSEKVIEKAKKDLPPIEGYRAFVAPVEQNTSILVKPGKLVQIVDQNSPTGRRDAGRDGDVYATFIGGQLVTNDPDVISWCEGHPNICRDTNDPMTAVWYNFKLAQVPLSNRDPSMPSGIDIDRALAGDYQQWESGGAEVNVVKQARDYAASQNEQAVEAP